MKQVARWLLLIAALGTVVPGLAFVAGYLESRFLLVCLMASATYAVIAAVVRWSAK